MKSAHPHARPWLTFKHQREARELSGLHRQVEAEEKSQEAMAALNKGDASQLPRLFRSLIDVREDNAHMTDEQIRREGVEQLAYQHAGVFLEKRDDGAAVLWDFDEILTAAAKVTVGSAKVVVETAGESFFEIAGPAAEYFMRYAAFSGLLQAIANRGPCPECSAKPFSIEALSKECDTCGNLGWVPVIPDESLIVSPREMVDLGL